MNIKQVLQFIRTTLENNLVAAVRALQSHIYTVKLQSNKVEVTNPTKLPDTFKVREVSPINNRRDIEKQTTELVRALTDQVTKVNTELKKLAPKNEIKINNLKDIPKAPTTVKVANPQKTVSINNWYMIAKEIGKLQKAVEALKLDPKIIVPDIKVPDIYVPEIKQPEIKNKIILDKLEKLKSTNPKEYVPVRLTDGEKFYRAIEELTQTISGGGGGRYAFQTADGTRTYGLVNILRQLMVVQEERWGLNNSARTDNITYTGEEDVDGNWIVRRVEKDGSSVEMSYATKKNNPDISDYDEAWAARVSGLQYDRFSVAFALE